MKFKFSNELKNNDVIEQKLSSIPEESWEEFFKEIVPMLNVNTKIKRVDIEFARAFTSDITVTFYFFGKGFADYVRFNAINLMFYTKFCEQNAITEKWTQFLKDNLGTDIYKKFVETKMKRDIEDSESGIEALKNRIDRETEKLEYDKNALKQWQKEHKERKQQFQNEFSGFLNEADGEIRK